MFGSSFASSLPPASAPAGTSPPKPAFGASSSSQSSIPPAAAPTLPFAGFGGFGSSSTKPSSSSSSSGVGLSKSPSAGGGGGGFNNFGGGGGGGLTLQPAAKRAAPSAATGSSGNATFGGNLFSAAKKSPAGASLGGGSTPSALPFAGFGGGGPSPSTRGRAAKAAGSSSFAGAASAAAAATSTALVPAPSSQLTTTSTSNALTTASRKHANASVEHACMSPDGRSFHSYLYDAALGRHAIVSEFAPFGEASHDAGTPRAMPDGSGAVSSLKVTTTLPSAVVDSLDIDPVMGLICVDGSNDDGRGKRRQRREVGEKAMISLPWMCLYTRTAAFLLSIGYEDDEHDNDGRERDGTVLQVLEPFEKHLLMAPRGSSILRVRPAPTSHSMFQRTGAMALLLREGDDEDGVGHVLVLYHGLPASISGGLGRGRDLGGRIDPSSEGAVTTPLRFDREDLVRGMQDTIDAENEAYNIASLREAPPSDATSPSAKRVVDFCFLTPSPSTSGAGGFASTSILILCTDGSIYGACPILFDGAVLPRSVVVAAVAHLGEEIEASAEHLTSMAAAPVPSLEQERVEARTRQCRAARRYLLDAFGIPEGTVGDGSAGASQPLQGSYYVSASVVHPRSSSAMDDRSFSQALAWQSRLQGPLVESDPSSALPACVCIESFGGTAGAGIVDGFAVARECNADHSSSPIHVEFGILPGEGSVLLPRFEFENDADCQLIDAIVRGTGAYVERASIMSDESSAGETRALATPSSSIGRQCSIIVDPLDDMMIHVSTPSQIATITTNAVAVTASCFKSRVGEATTKDSQGMSGIRTKVWSGLEITSSDATLVGACVSGDVHLGHILLAKVSNGSMEVVNITAAQCLYETSEQMKATSEQIAAIEGDDEALEILRRVQPLHELLQPLIDKVCNGLSKMGKIVGGATPPEDAGPETLAVFLETQRSCDANVLNPMEEMAKILSSRRELLKEMYEHQAAELVRLTALLDEFKQKYESNMKRLVELETNASVLAERSSAVLTATRDLRPKCTEAEVAYFKDLKRYETSCNKWQGTVDQLKKDATTSCDAMSAGAIETGDVRCLVDMPPPKIEVCHKLLRGEGQMLKQLEQKVQESSAVVKRLSKTISGLDSSDAARLRLLGGDKENQRCWL